MFEADDRLGGKIAHHRRSAACPPSTRAPTRSSPVCRRRSRWPASVGLGDSSTSPADRHGDGRGTTALHPIPAGLVLGVPAASCGLLVTTCCRWRGKLRAAAEPFLPRTDRTTTRSARTIRAALRRRGARTAGRPAGRQHLRHRHRPTQPRAPSRSSPSSRRAAAACSSARARHAGRTGASGPDLRRARAGMATLVDAARRATSPTAGVTCAVTGRPTSIEPRRRRDGASTASASTRVRSSPAPARARRPLLARRWRPGRPSSSIDYADVVMVDRRRSRRGACSGVPAAERLPRPEAGQRSVTAVSFGIAEVGALAHGGRLAGPARLARPRRPPVARPGRRRRAPTAASRGRPPPRRRRCEPYRAPSGSHVGARVPQYRPHHLDRVDAIEAASPPPVRPSRSPAPSYRGIGIPACIRQGRAAAAGDDRSRSQLARMTPDASGRRAGAARRRRLVAVGDAAVRRRAAADASDALEAAPMPVAPAVVRRRPPTTAHRPPRTRRHDHQHDTGDHHDDRRRRTTTTHDRCQPAAGSRRRHRRHHAKEPVIELGTLEIPKIGVDKTMYEGITLDHARPRARALAGHGAARPDRQRRRRRPPHEPRPAVPPLDQLVAGDEIIFNDADGDHVYLVTRTEIVEPDASGSSTRRRRRPPRCSPAIRPAPPAAHRRPPRARRPSDLPAPRRTDRRLRSTAARQPARAGGCSSPARSRRGVLAAGVRRRRGVRAARSREQPTRRRALPAGWLFAVAWLAPAWAGCGSSRAPGYIVAGRDVRRLPRVAALVVARPARGGAIGRPAAHTLAEAIRFVLPVRRRAAGHAGDRPGGGSAARRRPRRRRDAADVGRVPGRLRARRPSPSIAGDAPASTATGDSAVARTVRSRCWRRRRDRVVGGRARRARPRPDAARRSPPCRAAASRARAAIDTRATRGRRAPPRGDGHDRARDALDLVVWPENVIDVDRPSPTSVERDRGRRRGGPARRRRSRSASPRTSESRPPNALSSTPRSSSRPTARSRAATRRCGACPFGEYVPLRGLLEALGAPVDQVPRDAVAGTGPAVIDLPDGDAARRGDLVGGVLRRPRPRRRRHGGTSILINPTNGSSYTGTVLQTPADRVVSRCGRSRPGAGWCRCRPPASPRSSTPTATCYERTASASRAVITDGRACAAARTWYTVVGDWPIVALVGDRLSPSRASATMRSERRPGHSSSITVTGPSLTSATAHLGAEPSGGDRGAEAAQVGRRRRRPAARRARAGRRRSSSGGGPGVSPYSVNWLTTSTSLASCRRPSGSSRRRRRRAPAGARSSRPVVAPPPRVVVGHADEHAQTGADLADGSPRRSRRPATDPLHHGPRCHHAHRRATAAQSSAPVIELANRATPGRSWSAPLDGGRVASTRVAGRVRSCCVTGIVARPAR